MESDHDEIKRRLAAGEVIESEGSGREQRCLYRGSKEPVNVRTIWKLIREGWAREDGGGTYVADTPERAKERLYVLRVKRDARRQQLKDARLDKWAGWMEAARTRAERRAVAQRIVHEGMSLAGVDDDAVRLDGDPPPVE